MSAPLGDRYRLARELGAGGVATVCLAEGPEHHRRVALKGLRPDLAARLGSQRLSRQITLAANLRHPHMADLARRTAEACQPPPAGSRRTT